MRYDGTAQDDSDHVEASGSADETPRSCDNRASQLKRSFSETVVDKETHNQSPDHCDLEVPLAKAQRPDEIQINSFLDFLDV